jgi:hypothetical protein
VTRVEVLHRVGLSRHRRRRPRGWRLGSGVTFAALTTSPTGLRTAAVVGVDSVAGTAESSTCVAPAST